MSEQGHDENQTTPQPQPVTSNRRRALLKAGAVTPFVATLHSGSAFATASAFQCVAKNATEAPRKAVDPSTDYSDTWVRASVEVRSDGAYRYAYFVDGEWFTDDGYPCDPADFPHEVGSRDVLVAYKRVDDAYGSTVDLTEKGAWPKFQIDGNMHQPLTHSCMTSMMNTA